MSTAGPEAVELAAECGLILDPWQVDIVDAAASGGSETEVIRDGGQCIGSVAPVGVVDGGVELVVVAAPFGFPKAGVAT